MIATTFNIKKNNAVVLIRSNEILLKPSHCYHLRYEHCYMIMYAKPLHSKTQNHAFCWFHGANKAKKNKTLSP